MDKEYLNLSIRNREGVIFEDKVSSITSYNDSGKFDVLPQHSNFISLLQKELVYRDLEGNEERLEVGNGIIRVKENNVKIYLGITG